MRIIWKSLIVVCLALGMANYLIYLSTGNMPLRDLQNYFTHNQKFNLRNLFSVEKLTADTKEATKDIVDSLSDSTPPEPTQVYRWIDANGQVHYGDEAKKENAEKILITPQNAISFDTTDDNIEIKRKDPLPLETPVEKAAAAAEAMKASIQAQQAEIEGL